VSCLGIIFGICMMRAALERIHLCFRCHGICVCDGRLYFHGHVNEMLAALEMAVRSEDIITIHEEYRGLGYGLSQPCELGILFREKWCLG